MSHLEELLTEYYQWLGHVVKCGALVGRRAKGGWEMELDVVTYDPRTNRVLHVEPSLDAHSWAKREERFAKKFEAGRKYILQEVFPWLPPYTFIEQRAILPGAGVDRRVLAGGTVQTVDEMMAEIRDAVRSRGVASKAAISEHYPLLRTIQFVVSGYYRVVSDGTIAPKSLGQAPA